jgi:DNA repair protein RecN (Recombination protein N)
VLRELRVRNLALLEDAHVEFGPGLNVVTGATGAGKSLLLSALTLLVGGRFSKEMLRTGTDQASVDGVFDLDDETARAVAALQGDDADAPAGEVVVRRRIDASGKNRCEIDGRLVSVGELRDLGRRLCEIHGQNEHQALLDPAEQTILLDHAGKLTDERARFAAKLAVWRDLAARVEALRSGERGRAARVEALQALVAEIRGAKLRVGELEELRRERTLLADSARHADALALASSLLDGGEDDDGAVDRVGRAAREIGATAELLADARAAQEALDAALDRLSEASRSIAAARERVESDPARLEDVEERLASLTRLLRRHGPGEEEALAALAKAERELDDLSGGESGADGLEKRLAAAERDVAAAGAALVEKRRAAAKPFAAAVKKALAHLDMPGTQFVVDVRGGELAAATELGVGAVEFLASPNPGEELRPLAKIASGGELARVALAIKSELGRADSSCQRGAPLLVFDEIDADVGPRLGAVIGRRLAEVARGRQALVVTHLPQVAAFGDVHLRVVKKTAAGRTTAHVEPLASAARELEIAEMIRGQGKGREALDQARSMIADGKCA